MDKQYVLELIKTYFKEEVKNPVNLLIDHLEITLADKTKVKIFIK